MHTLKSVVHTGLVVLFLIGALATVYALYLATALMPQGISRRRLTFLLHRVTFLMTTLRRAAPLAP